jgi:signal transduction histidine kinase
MSEQTPITEILSFISAPAFSVYDGVITHCNDAAQKLLFYPETPVTSMLEQNKAEYAAFQEGCLYITLSHNNCSYSASVVRVNRTNIFVLEEDNDRIELKTLSLTASNMRQPLSSMIATASGLTASLEQTEDPKLREQLRHMNRNLYRMHRMLCNMSDALQYADVNSNNLVCQNIVSVVEAIFRQSQELCRHSGIQLQYRIPNEPILCAIDETLLERGIYNMISNAIKFSPEGSVIQASLICRENRIYISIADQGSGIPDSILSSVFQRYRRTPGLEDSRFGLGLGLVLVRCAARVHGGTVLVDQPGQAGARITISFPVRQSTSAMVRSNVVRVDYAGGWDHGLLELSDVIPANLY